MSKTDLRWKSWNMMLFQGERSESLQLILYTCDWGNVLFERLSFPRVGVEALFGERPLSQGCICYLPGTNEEKRKYDSRTMYCTVPEREKEKAGTSTRFGTTQIVARSNNS